MIGSGSSQPHLEHVCSGGWAHPLSMSGCLGRRFRNGCKEVNSPCHLFCKHVTKMKVSFGVVPLPPQRCVLMPSCARWQAKCQRDHVRLCRFSDEGTSPLGRPWETTGTDPSSSQLISGVEVWACASLRFISQHWQGLHGPNFLRHTASCEGVLKLLAAVLEVSSKAQGYFFHWDKRVKVSDQDVVKPWKMLKPLAPASCTVFV